MSLNARLSAFFLATLALVLAGFSGSLYFLARAHLHRQAEERLQAGLDTLVAAVELESGGLEWEPRHHHLTLGEDAAVDQVRWTIQDEKGRSVAHSVNLGDTTLSIAEQSESKATQANGPDGTNWYVATRRLHAPKTVKPERGHHRTLVLTAGLSLVPLERTLHTLALALTGLTVGIWLVAAFAGRFLARKALAPLTRMAVAARTMDATDSTGRLPEPCTGDELNELQRAFNGLLDRLQEAFERQRRFTGDASHQLRTPLTAMLGQIEVALRRDRSATEYRDTLDRAHGQATHLRKIVEALLFLTRADIDAAPGVVEETDLSTWLPVQLERWSVHVRSADLHTQCAADSGCAVRVQAVLLGQLLDNLLENAFKYSEPGTAVTVSLERNAGTVILSVSDAGRGIAAEDLPHVFEPFYRAEEVRRLGRPGVGLGLAVVRRIAVALGGDMEVDSAPGQGSRFTLRLPAVAPPSLMQKVERVGPVTVNGSGR